MQKLYIANCTRQHQTICYRLDFDRDGTRMPNPQQRMPLEERIAPGKQEPLSGGELHENAIAHIIRQLTPFGLLHVKETSRQDGVCPWVYDLDRPVAPEIIAEVFAYNQGVRSEEGKERRRLAAVAANEFLNDKAGEQPRALEVSVEQLDQSEFQESRIEEGYRIDPNAGPPVQPKGGRRGGRAAVA